MKKLVILLVVMVASTNAFARVNEDSKVFSKLNRTSTLNGLVYYLNADSYQSNRLEYVFSLTDDKLKAAINSQNDLEIEKAIYFNLANVKAFLSEEQYKKYLVILNVSLNYAESELLLGAL